MCFLIAMELNVMLSLPISSQEQSNSLNIWNECYPPDYDHGGQPLLGDDARQLEHLLEDVAFLGIDCSTDGRMVILVAVIRAGFVDIWGQCVGEGEPLATPIADALRDSTFRIPVDRSASHQLGLDVELGPADLSVDWETVAQRVELDILSTISHLAHFDTTQH